MPAIKYKKKTYAGATFPVLEMTKAEYDALPDTKKMDGTVYMITDDDGGWEAERSTYDNTTSGLTATNVQDALDELNSKRILTVESANNFNTVYIHAVQCNSFVWICGFFMDTGSSKSGNVAIVKNAGTIINEGNQVSCIGEHGDKATFLDIHNITNTNDILISIQSSLPSNDACRFQCIYPLV